MIRHNLGVTVKEIDQVKSLDSDYFADHFARIQNNRIAETQNRSGCAGVTP
jgi:hypothetical protein